LKKSDFHFDLPPELIAQAPLAKRSAGRLLLLDVPVRTWQDRKFSELVSFLRKGDLLVFNDTRVLPARLYGHKESGGQVEILIERVTGTHEAVVQLGVSKKPQRRRRDRVGRWQPCHGAWPRRKFFPLAF
jgi:S-adenosylmethionine:tRNA ribosyltransferase-isomerase